MPVDPSSYIPKSKPLISDSQAARIAAHVPASNLRYRFPKVKPFWLATGPQLLMSPTANATPLTAIPAPVKSQPPIVSVVRDLPQVDFGPLSGWDITPNKIFLVLSLLSILYFIK